MKRLGLSMSSAEFSTKEHSRLALLELIVLRVLYYIRTIFRGLLHSAMPRKTFINSYTPSSESERGAHQDISNRIRRAAYYAKKTFRGSNND